MVSHALVHLASTSHACMLIAHKMLSYDHVHALHHMAMYHMTLYDHVYMMVCHMTMYDHVYMMYVI